MENPLLAQRALREVLCCLKCKGELKLILSNSVECASCGRRYAVEDGIFILMPPEGPKEQREEQKMREEVAAGHTCVDSAMILDTVSHHHCISVMSKRADDFRVRFDQQNWILDLGCGTAYYWRKTTGANLILMDFALNNLKAGKALLGNSPGAIFVQADAANLPVKPGSLSGIWSVQTTQHFPDSVMEAFLGSIKIILKERFWAEIYNLNPALLYRIIYRLKGRKLHLKGDTGRFMLNRLNASELTTVWQSFLDGATFEIGYSELFFHPELHFVPQSGYLVAMERLLGRVHLFSKFFARQIHIKISSGF